MIDLRFGLLSCQNNRLVVSGRVRVMWKHSESKTTA